MRAARPIGPVAVARGRCSRSARDRAGARLRARRSARRRSTPAPAPTHARPRPARRSSRASPTSPGVDRDGGPRAATRTLYVTEQQGGRSLVRNGTRRRRRARPHRPGEPGRRRAGPARHRVLPRRRAALRPLHRHGRRHADRRVRDARRNADRVVTRARSSPSTSRRRTTTAASSRSGPTATSTSGSATAARRATAAPATRRGQRAVARHAARQDPAHRPDAVERAVPRTPCPPDNPFVGDATTPGPRSGRTGCATRGGSRSTARPATSGSATSARTRGRRSTVAATNGAAPGRAPTSAGTGSRARTRSTGDAPATPSRRLRDQQDTGTCAVIGGYVYRGKRSRRCAAVRVLRQLRRRDPRPRPRRRRWGHHGGHRRRVRNVSSFGESNNGTLYVISLSDGVFRIDPP